MTETLLEMYYFKSFIEAFAYVYGTRVFKAFKPSPQKEAWLGFDQAWANTTIEENDFFNTIADYNNNGEEINRNVIFAFFLQYKVVQTLTRGRLVHRPPNFVNPYYKVPISLIPNQHNHLSQHECLVKLSDLTNSEVNYVCPMLFPPIDIYTEPDIHQLQFVTVDSQYHNFPNNETHSINFQEPDAQPVWKSESIEGKSLNFKSFSQKKFHPYNVETLQSYLNNCKNVLLDNSRQEREVKLAKILPQSLLILSMQLPPIHKNELDPYGEEIWP